MREVSIAWADSSQVLAAEIELADLRKQFVATSEEIAKDLSLMVGRIDEEPPEVRALQLAAAEEIAAAQERLRLEAEQLEGSPRQRIAILQAVCEAQQAAQLQLTVIIKRHRPSTLLRANLDERLANIARQLEVTAAASRSADEDAQILADRSTDLSSTDDDAPEKMVSPSLPLAVIIKAGTSLALLLVVASAGLVLFFFFASTPKRAAPLSTMSIADLNSDVAAAPLPRTDSLPSQPPTVPAILPDGRQTSLSATAAQTPVTPLSAPPSPILRNDADTYVPVVFTHKDRGTALRAFAELQRKYPKLLAHRQSELQLLDTGKNGIWYRLVVLPAASHQEASETCGRLGVAGYDRCWVKAY